MFFADFSKGFDLVDHCALMKELQVMNVHIAIIRWIGTFLTQQPQHCRIAGSLSSLVFPFGGIPQGTNLALMLFAILVNQLVSSWPLCAKYVDDTTICEVVPRCSPSYLQVLVNEINEFATVEACDLIQKKCKEMEINFLKHQCVNLQPLVVGDTVAKQVDNYKLLGVYISSGLSWNEHVDFIVKKATKRLYSLRILRKAGVQEADLVRIYCSLIRSVLEYGAPVWSDLPGYLSNIIELVQRRALRIICPLVE